MISTVGRRVFNVLHRKDKWILIKKGDSEAIKHFSMKKTAVSHSRYYAKIHKPSELRVHSINGRMQFRHIYDEYNPYEKPLRSFFDRLSFLNGLTHIITDQLGFVKKRLSSNEKELNNIFSGTLLLFLDITKKYGTSLPPFYTSGIFATKGKDYFSTIDHLCNRESGWCISQACEAFETYLKDTIAICFYKSLLNAKREDITRFNKKIFLNKKNLTLDLGYWKKFVRYLRNSNDKWLDIIRDRSQAFNKSEMKNSHSLNLQKWYVISTEVRHAVTHFNFIIKAAKMSNWDLEMKHILSKRFPGNYINKDYILKINRKDAEFNLRIFIEYGYQIFKYLSQIKGYKWEVFDEIMRKK